MNLSDTEKKELLQIARSSIRAALERKQPPRTPASGQLAVAAGAFVTLHLDRTLRGCVGYIEPRYPLARTVAEAAEKAAFEDPRFPPVNGDELPVLNIEISVLSPLERVDNVDRIEVGKHGLVVESGFHRGLLLPQVADEYGWNRTQFLQQTSIKAGLPGDAWKKPGTSIYSFTVDLFSEQEMAARET